MQSDSHKLDNMLAQNPFMGVSVALASLLREDLLSCTIKPGERLKEVDIAEQYNVSRTTVRRAFDFLLQEGILEKNSSRGVFSKSMNKESSARMNELRIILEPRAASIAAKRRTKNDLLAIKRQLDNLQNASDNLIFAKADLEFHTAIYLSTHNPYIVSASNLILSDIHRIKMYSSENIFHEQFNRVLTEHTNIYNAILDMDSQAALNASKKHAMIGTDPIIIELTGLD